MCAVITPLCGIGVISLERAYSLIVGCCIGTTTTGLIAALASMGDGFAESMQVYFLRYFIEITVQLSWNSFRMLFNLVFTKFREVLRNN